MEDIIDGAGRVHQAETIFEKLHYDYMEKMRRMKEAYNDKAAKIDLDEEL